MMDCERFMSRLGPLLDERLPEAERAEALAHAADCEDCGALLAIAREPEPGAAETGEAEALTRSILASTGSDPCAAARDRLAEPDAHLRDAVEAGLLAEHLARCPACREFELRLQELDALLPTLAEMKPEPGFVDQVLAATSGREQRSAGATTRPARAPRRWWQRPRIAVELAYAASMLLLVTSALPGSPLAGAARQLLELATRLEQPVAQIESRIADGMEQAVTRTGDGLRDTQQIAQLATRRSDAWLGTVRDGMGTLWTEAASSKTNTNSGDRERDDGAPGSNSRGETR